jgi:capsid protein
MANINRPSRQEIFLRDFISNIEERGIEIKDKALSSALRQAKTIAGIQKSEAYYNGRSVGGNYFEGSHRSGGAQWPYGVSNAGRSRILNHNRILLNARDAYHDSPQARAIVDRYADTVADTGLILELNPRPEILGISPEAAKKWARNVEARFDLWARSKKQHRSETLTWYQSQRLYQIFQHRDNDIFVRLFYSSDKSLQNSLQWEFIDPKQIMGFGYTGTGGHYLSDIYDGIERDGRGREKAYVVYIRKEDGTYDTVKISRKGEKSGRLHMLHGFNPEYAGQRRGYSRIGFAIQGFENLTDFKSAHIKKAIAQSSIIAMMENKELDPSNVFESILTKHGQGPAANQFGSNPEPSSDAENVTTEALARPECYQIPEATVDVPGSTIILNARRGDTLKPFAQNAPADSFDKFVDAFMYYLSAAAGIPLEVVLMRFNANYSASRGTLILFWRTVMMWRDEWAADCGNPTVEMWAAEEIAAGRIQAPGFSDPVLRAAWLRCNWRGSPIPDIDPSRTAKARRENLSMGLSTGERESRNLNGSDFESNKAQLEHEYGKPVPPPWEKPGSSKGQEGSDNIVQAITEAINETLDEREDN